MLDYRSLVNNRYTFWCNSIRRKERWPTTYDTSSIFYVEEQNSAQGVILNFFLEANSVSV